MDNRRGSGSNISENSGSGFRATTGFIAKREKLQSNFM